MGIEMKKSVFVMGTDGVFVFRRAKFAIAHISVTWDTHLNFASVSCVVVL